MLRYCLHKIGYALLTLWGVVTVIFLLFTVLPGDPARMMLDQNESAEQLARVKAKYGFDQPLATQYLYYLNDLSPISWHSFQPNQYTSRSSGKYHAARIVATSNGEWVIKTPYLRESFRKSGTTVTQIIGNTLPNTILLALLSIGLAIVLGVSLGIVSALKADTIWDRWIAVLSSLGMSVPSFFSAILAAWLFGFVWQNYTGLPMTGSLYEIDDLGNGRHIAWKNAILPALVLGIRPLGVVIQLMRNALLETLSQDYIRTARAKGLSERQIVWQHALKNSLNPVITALSGWFASMLAGAVFVEFIFGWNGLGKEIVEALNHLDLPVIMGAVLTIAASFILVNILVDLAYAYLDPRVRLE